MFLVRSLPSVSFISHGFELLEFYRSSSRTARYSGAWTDRLSICVVESVFPGLSLVEAWRASGGVPSGVECGPPELGPCRALESVLGTHSARRNQRGAAKSLTGARPCEGGSAEGPSRPPLPPCPPPRGSVPLVVVVRVREGQPAGPGVRSWRSAAASARVVVDGNLIIVTETSKGRMVSLCLLLSL